MFSIAPISPAITATVAAVIILIIVSLLLIYIMYTQSTSRKRRIEVANFDYLFSSSPDERSTFRKFTDWFTTRKTRNQNYSDHQPLLYDNDSNYGSFASGKLDSNVYEL